MSHRSMTIQERVLIWQKLYPLFVYFRKGLGKSKCSLCCLQNLADNKLGSMGGYHIAKTLLVNTALKHVNLAGRNTATTTNLFPEYLFIIMRELTTECKPCLHICITVFIQPFEILIS